MNAKMSKIVGALVFSAVFIVSTAFAQEMAHSPMYPAYEATSLVGKTVNDEAGNYIGKISDFVIDEANHRVSLVVLTDVPGFKSDQVTFPYECLQKSGDGTLRIIFSNGVVTGIGSGEGSSIVHMLKQYPVDSPLYTIPQPTNPNWVAEVYRTYGYLPYWVQKGEKAPSASDFSEVTKLLGTKVATTEGKASATITDMTIDSSGRADLLILSNVQGRGNHEVVVPFDALKRSSDGTLALNVAGDRLAMAPVFIKSDINKPGYEARVDRFFGLSPHWMVKNEKVKNEAANDPYRWGGEAQGF